MSKDKLRVLQEAEDGDDKYLVEIHDKSGSGLERPKNQMAFSNLKFILFLLLNIVLVICVYMYYKMLQNSFGEFISERYWYITKGGPCTHSKEHIHEMSRLAVDASNALSNLGSNPVVCYGTLLGALRTGHVLPWDNNVDVCVLDPIPHDVTTIRHQFSKFDIVVEPYDSWKGVYRFHRHQVEGFINVFSECNTLDRVRFSREPADSSIASFQTESSENDGSTDAPSSMSGKQRKTFTNKWLCPHGRLPHLVQLILAHTKPIPAAFFKPPFQTVALGKRSHNWSVPVPNGDSHILKYFYPGTWWFESKPLGCK